MTTHSETVHTERHGAIAVIVVDNPPVNAIAPSVRDGIAAAVREVGADPTARAVVLHCAGASFMAGADIRKLATGPTRPTSEIIAELEALTVPVVAALHGSALGGGLEFALGAHFRCAHAATRLGLPEVNLGLIPGAGGTQRLPRLIGIEPALELIAGGKSIGAEEAARLGIVDRVFPESDVLAAALAYARELVESNAAPRRSSQLQVAGASDAGGPFEKARATYRKTRRGEPAPLKAIEAVNAAATLPFAEGIAIEARLFAECRASSESRALRHLFFAERQVARVRDLPADVEPRAISNAAVIGGGTMGRGIAIAFLNAGLPVTLVETDAAALDKALNGIGDVYASAVAKQRMTDPERTQRLAQIRGTLDLGDLARADLVIEAVFEDMALKKRLFSDLDRICHRSAILATNTSALDVDQIASSTRRATDVVGLHFFSPAHVMRLVEIVRGRHTGAEVLATALKLVKRLGKIGVVAGNCDGFIGNRMLNGYRREAEFLLLEGASPQQVDRALVAFGMPMGPYTMADMAGLDVGAAARRRRRAEGTLPDDPRFAVISDRLVELGRFGQKTGRGFYRYEAAARDAQPDPEVDELIASEAGRLGVARRTVADHEVVERCVYPLINEAARILDERIAQRPGDVDVVWVNGYGFPRVRGGPMQYADEVGLPAVLATLERFARELGPQYWEPAALIRRLVNEHRTFASLNEE
jgi:3-hydroxyacyl-CoA dehydrogenase